MDWVCQFVNIGKTICNNLNIFHKIMSSRDNEKKKKKLPSSPIARFIGNFN